MNATTSNRAAPAHPLPWPLRGATQFALGRLMVYGTVGLASELFFYNLCKVARGTPLLRWAFQFDWRVDPRLGLDAVWSAPTEALYGQASLWMFGVYGGCSLLLVEPLYRRTARWPMLARALVYALAILVGEWLTGWGLKGLTRYDIWYYADAGALGRMTSFYLVPAWCVTGLVAEGLYRGMLRLVALVPEAAPLFERLRAPGPGRPTALGAQHA